jgi:hypothetical protein
MNIFAVDDDPVAAARMLCDRHVVKMTLETAQILCTVAGGPYRPTHRNHPCVLWAAARRSNYRWLARHGLALAAEFTRRYGGVHKSEAVIRRVASRGPKKGGRRDPFVQTMPKKYRGADAVAAYRRFYRGEKAKFATWRAPARAPAWWVDGARRRRYSRKDVQAAPRAAKEAQRAGAGAVRAGASVGGRGARDAGAAPHRRTKGARGGGHRARGRR